MQINRTDGKIDERSCPGIPASIVSSLRNYMQELEGHVMDHITKVRSLEETLLALDSFRRTSASMGDGGDTRPPAPPHTLKKIPAASLMPVEPAIKHLNTNVANPEAPPRMPSSVTYQLIWNLFSLRMHPFRFNTPMPT